VRIVAGRFGGRRIVAPAGRATRPTPDRVREALFSILGALDGEHVLDLFAGSGALGLEALSRGAARAVFVDEDPRAVAVVRRNLEALGVQAPVHRRDALAFLGSPAAAALAPFGLVFLDPPYSSGPGLAARLSERLLPLLAQDALIVSESHQRAPLDLTLPREDERTYGDTRVALFRAR